MADYAHSLPGRPELKWEKLGDHLYAVSARAAGLVPPGLNLVCEAGKALTVAKMVACVTAGIAVEKITNRFIFSVA